MAGRCVWRFVGPLPEFVVTKEGVEADGDIFEEEDGMWCIGATPRGAAPP